MTISQMEEFLVRKMAKPSLDGSETLVQHSATIVAMLAVHRWGEDLERGPGGQQYAHLDEVAEEAMYDLAGEGYLPVVGDDVLDGVEIVVDAIEEDGTFDVDEPGGLVERVGGGGRDV